MELNIMFDPDAERVAVLYDNYMMITAQRTADNRVVFSSNIDNIDEDDINFVIRKICNLVLNLRSV